MRIKHRNLISLTLFSLLVFTLACQKKPNETQNNQEIVSTPIEFKEEHQVSLKCGANTTEVTLSVKNPPSLPFSTHHQKFALLLSGSPGTEYFSEDNEAHSLLNRLLELGYRVIQVKYPHLIQKCKHAGKVSGFYTACCRQGLTQVFDHNFELAKAALTEAGYFQSKHPERKLVGLGFSLGSLQLTTMAFHSGLEFQKLAFFGVVYGDMEKSCNILSWLSDMNQPLANLFFANLADSMTKSSAGCSQKKGHVLEYEAKFNIDQLPHFHSGSLAIFEGTQSYPLRKTIQETMGPLALAAAQILIDVDYNPSEYIQNSRPDLTEVHWYKNCGHDVLGCASARPQITQDVLEYLERP